MSKTPRGQVMRPTNAQQKEPTHVVSPRISFRDRNQWMDPNQEMFLESLTSFDSKHTASGLDRIHVLFRSNRWTIVQSRSFDLSCLDMTRLKGPVSVHRE
jgi:hypothetical protein